MAIEEEKKSNIFKVLTQLLSVQALGLGSGFLVHIILAKQLSPAEYGIYNFIFSTSMICGLLGNFGFQASAVRIMIQLITDKNGYELKKFFGFSTIFIFSLSSILSLIIFFIISKLDSSSQYSREILIIGIGLTPLMALVKLNSGVLKGFKKGALALAYESSLKEIIFLMILLVGIVISISASTALSALYIVSIIFFFLFIFSFVYILNLIRSPNYLSQKLKDSSYKTWLKISFPMMLVISIQYLILRSDIIMLGLMMDVSDVGIYSAGAKLAQAATITMIVLNIFFSPRASELFHKKNYRGLRKIYYKTLKLQAVSTLGIVVILAFISSYVIRYIGLEYEGALSVIYVLLAGFALNSLWGPIPFLMIMTKYEYQAMWMTFLAAILNIGLNFILIPTYGIIGAAIATAISINLRNMCALIYIYKTGILGGNKSYE